MSYEVDRDLRFEDKSNGGLDMWCSCPDLSSSAPDHLVVMVHGILGRDSIMGHVDGGTSSSSSFDPTSLHVNTHKTSPDCNKMSPNDQWSTDYEYLAKTRGYGCKTRKRYHSAMKDFLKGRFLKQGSSSKMKSKAALNNEQIDEPKRNTRTRKWPELHNEVFAELLMEQYVYGHIVDGVLLKDFWALLIGCLGQTNLLNDLLTKSLCIGAKRIIPEWVYLDAEARRFTSRLLGEELETQISPATDCEKKDDDLESKAEL